MDLQKSSGYLPSHILRKKQMRLGTDWGHKCHNLSSAFPVHKWPLARRTPIQRLQGHVQLDMFEKDMNPFEQDVHLITFPGLVQE
jgi:hypothetical protein